MNLSKAYKEMAINENSNTFKQLQIPKITKKEKAKYMPLLPGTVQTDLQFWNNDNGYRYLLVCVDIVNKGIDFEAIKDKTPKSIIDGFTNIFKRRYIYQHPVNEDLYPRVIYSDSGSEFDNAELLKWYTKHKIKYRHGRAGRKSQTAVVEAFNSMISKLLAVKTTIEQKELNKTNDIANNRQWVKYLPKLREVMNDKNVKVKAIIDFFNNTPKVDKKLLLSVDDKVFVINEKPRDINDNKLPGRFRIGDFRYEQVPRKIVSVIANASGNPVRYAVEGIKNATFSRGELIKTQ